MICQVYCMSCGAEITVTFNLGPNGEVESPSFDQHCTCDLSEEDKAALAADLEYGLNNDDDHGEGEY